jgi:uncharacterized membrane protein YhaH (DUF805 family)
MFEQKSISVVMEDVKCELVPPDAPKTLIEKLFGFQGRIGRIQYIWLILMPWSVALLVLGFILAVSPSRDNIIFGLASFILGIALIWIFIAVMTKRLHDIDKSGWWQLIQVIPIIGYIMPFYMAVRPGTKDVNRYGQKP